MIKGSADLFALDNRDESILKKAETLLNLQYLVALNKVFDNCKHS